MPKPTVASLSIEVESLKMEMAALHLEIAGLSVQVAPAAPAHVQSKMVAPQNKLVKCGICKQSGKTREHVQGCNNKFDFRAAADERDRMGA